MNKQIAYQNALNNEGNLNGNTRYYGKIVPTPKVSLVKLPKMTFAQRVNLLHGNKSEQEAID